MQSTLFGKNFITTEDWSNDEIEFLLDVAGDLKRRFSIGELHDHILRGKTLFMLFFEESTRNAEFIRSWNYPIGRARALFNPFRNAGWAW